MTGCTSFIPGYVEELKTHIKQIHKLNTSLRNSVPLRCANCGTIFTCFKRIKDHILRHHKPHTKPRSECENPSDPQEPMEVEDEIGFMNDEGITNPNYFTGSVSREELHGIASSFITTMRCDVSLTETKIKMFMEHSNNILDNYQRFVLGLVKNLLTSKNLDTTDNDVIKLINEMSISDVYTDVRNPNSNMSYLSGTALCSVPEPVEVVLGTRKVLRTIRYQRESSRKTRKVIRVIKKNNTVKDTMHYIPIKDTISLIMKNSCAREMVAREIRSDEQGHRNVLNSFKDGALFRTNEFLQKYPFALRISLHVDDVETCNPLGSRKTKQKLTIFSFKLQNIADKINSTVDRVYVCLVVKCKTVKKYGIKQIVEPLIKDLITLQSDQGITIQMNGKSFTVRATLVHILGDTAAIHELLELMPPQSNIFCRACYITRKDLHNGRFGNEHTLRTSESYELDLAAVNNGSLSPAQCGVIRENVFNSLKYFHITQNMSFDPMHDVLEGIIPLAIKKILNDFVNISKSLTEIELNSRISNFDYGTAESKDKPSANFSAKSLKTTGHALSQSASQMWLFLRATPFLFTDLLSKNVHFMNIIRDILKITFYSFSNTLTTDMIEDFKNTINNFQINFKICFPLTKPTNKVHHVTHYPKIIEDNGPIAKMSCLQFEANFKNCKSQTKTCGNFKNITLSLTNRTNLKQINAILQHRYEIDKITIVSSVVVKKAYFDFHLILFDLPEYIRCIKHAKINGTSLRPDLVVKYKSCGSESYGVLKAIIENNNDYTCIIYVLEIIRFCEFYNSYEVKMTEKVVRVPVSIVCTRKTYSFWKCHNMDNSLFISLKYED